MKKYLVLLIFIMQGTVGMLSVKELSDVLRSTNAFCPPQIIPQTEEQKKTCMDAIKITNFTDITNIDLHYVYKLCNFLIENNLNKNCALLLSTAYKQCRSEYISDYWLTQEILKEGKDVTFESIEKHLNRPKAPMHLKVLGMIIDLYVENPSKDLSTLCLDSIQLSQVKEFLSNYPLYRRRKLIAASEQERIKSEFIEKIARKFKK